MALTFDPLNLALWRQLADLCRDSGDATGAISAFAACLKIEPDNAETLNQLGISLANAGRTTQAIDVFHSAIKCSPSFAQVHYNLGVALVQSDRLDDAESSFRIAVELRPEYSEGFLGLGNVQYTLGKNQEAIASFREAIRLCPIAPDPLNSLGLALIKDKRASEATVFLRQAIRLKQDFEGAYNNLGLALSDEGRYREAEQAFESALQLNPKSAEAFANLGNLFKEEGRLNASLICYDMAIAYSPSCVSARWNRSLALLQNGEFEAGWREYEWRWARTALSHRRPFFQPEWDGKALQGRTCLVYCEQGLGDVLQFIRYTEELKKIGAIVVLETPSPLVGIAATCRWVDQVVCEGEKLPSFDVHLPIMSLPRLLGTRQETIPATIPYLFPHPDRVGYWKTLLAKIPGLKVGIAWQGNPHHQWDRHRSVQLSRFAALAEIQGVSLISLQRGPGTEQLGDVAFPIHSILDSNILDSECLLDTAAIMKSIDLVITVDTATAHLAGAVGASTWLLLSTLVDWRWLLAVDTSPWYPTMRLFRQELRGEWSGPFNRISKELLDLIAAKVIAER